ncbi:MAG TPA: hypothetical protein VJT31_14625 [Rugosimonospora sp.]|nr:hypothetical protein [Rugosimonospora sp.]
MDQCVHHISTDGLGSGLLNRRVAGVYSAFAQGGSAPPRALPRLRVLVAHEAAYRASARYAADRDVRLRSLATVTRPGGNCYCARIRTSTSARWSC